MTTRYLLGLDVGGSSIKYQLAMITDDDRPVVVKQDTLATPASDPVAAFADIARDIAGDDLAGVVIAIPGLVDSDTGTVLRSVNLPHLDGVHLGARLGDILGVPVDIVNDGRAAAIAEARWGAGDGHSDVFTLALGTGIAGCHVVNGAVAAGAHGIAGELGHIVVEPDGELCACGQRGCLETVIGAPALRRGWHAAGGEGSPRDLLVAYENGDARALPIVDRAGRSLGDALLTLLALVDPGCVVIGGGLASAPHRLVQLAVAHVDEKKTFHTVPPIVAAELGRWAGAVGCVGIAVDRLTRTVTA